MNDACLKVGGEGSVPSLSLSLMAFSVTNLSLNENFLNQLTVNTLIPGGLEQFILVNDAY